MRIIALVDYDNVRATPDRTAIDATLNLEELFDRVSLVVRGSLPDANEIDLRLYGGWIGEDGRYSRNAEWMLAALPNVGGRHHGLRLRAHLVTNAACRPNELLVGTVRVRTRPVRQKMVDGLMTIDALHLANEPAATFLVISDDDDLVPCVLALSRTVSAPLFLYRLRPAGDGLNDAMLSRIGIRLRSLRA